MRSVWYWISTYPRWSRRRRCLRSVTGACERGEYPRWGAPKHRTLEGCPSNKICQVLGHSSRVRLLSDANPGVFATLKPPGYRAVTPSASLSEWNSLSYRAVTPSASLSEWNFLLLLYNKRLFQERKLYWLIKCLTQTAQTLAEAHTLCLCLPSGW